MSCTARWDLFEEMDFLSTARQRKLHRLQREGHLKTMTTLLADQDYFSKKWTLHPRQDKENYIVFKEKAI
ncbi:hypothetical protein CEXT_670051 [Caerostris extrusa]|uniref:Uncharacterized protein n=1 Tax=Caerostris extrusa TaxID=172846 RepID=A0AAV4PEH3_CAEEX|nr:hypothetical protein CEXT_670051 [Caerostris extrusa]